MKSGKNIPEFLFIILDEGGNIIYEYPKIELSHLYSSLISSIHAIGESIYTDKNIRSFFQINFFWHKMVTFKEQSEIFSLIMPEDYEQPKELLITLTETVKNLLSYDLSSGIVRVKKGKEKVDKEIEKILKKAKA